MRRHTYLRTCLFACVLLLLCGLAACRAAGTPENKLVDLAPGGVHESEDSAFKIPDTVETLYDHTFDAYVFPAKKERKAWLLFFYAPWCPHCKNVMPQFLNASVVLDKSGLPHARFAIVQSPKSPKITRRFNVNRYPTILYTTGKPGAEIAFNYEGGHTQASFMHFATYLQQAATAGSFAVDVSSEARFDKVERQLGANQRVPFYVYVPRSSSSTQQNQRTARWNIAIDGAATIGNARFSVLYEHAMPDASEASEDEADASAPPSAPSTRTQTYKDIVAIGKKCAAKGAASGPDGEVLIAASDRFAEPDCYTGPWLAVDRRNATSLHPTLSQYLTINGFHAVEELHAGMFGVLSEQKKNYLALIVTNGTMNELEQSMVTSLRHLVQKTSAHVQSLGLSIEEQLALPAVTWAYVDGAEYPLWLTRYDIAETEMPAFLIVDTLRERLFRARTRAPEFEAIKRQLPWKVGGPQEDLLATFVRDVLDDRFRAEKTSIAATVAEFFRTHLWKGDTLHSLLNYDDFAFVAVVCAVLFFMFLIFLGLVLEPLMTRFGGLDSEETLVRAAALDMRRREMAKAKKEKEEKEAEEAEAKAQKDAERDAAALLKKKKE